MDKSSKNKTPVDNVRRTEELEKEGYEMGKSNTLKMATILAVSMIMNVFLIWLGFFYFPRSDYVATSNAAAVCKITPLNEPHIHHQVVADFAVEAALQIYTYDHVNYRRQITTVTEKYFSPAFRDDFMKVFGDSANLKSVIENFYIVSSSTAGRPPQIIKAGIKNGAYVWVVQVPINVYYISGRKNQEEKILATVEVTRTDASRINPRAIAVSNIVTRQMIN